MAYTQSATGQFTVYLTPHRPHCGPRTGIFPIRQQFDYRLTIAYPPSVKLSGEGFLVDNLTFAGFFAALTGSHVAISCEELVKLLAWQLHAICEQFRPTLTLTLTPIEGVAISYTCPESSDGLGDGEWLL